MNTDFSSGLKKTILITALMTVAFIFRPLAYSLDNYLIASALLIVRNIIHISIISVWTLTIYMRVINKRIRKMLISVALLMVGWLLVKTCKWEFLYDTDTLTRYLWYAYYIPMILIPLLGVFITSYLGKSDDYTLPRKYMLLYIPTFILLALIFTNDFHRLVFDFPDGIYYFNTSYTYGPLFFVVSAWFVVLGFYFVLKLLIKSRVPGSRSFQKVHIVIMACAVFFWVFYAFFDIDADLTAVDCTLITLLLESAIQSGLIKTNTNYKKLFEISSVAAQISDNDFDICVRSEEAEFLSRDILRSAVEMPQNLGEYILNCEKISGGYIYWQNDIKYITEIIETLQETQKQLSENNYLLQAELEVKEKRAKTEEKNRLFNVLIKDISPQLAKAEYYISEAEKNDKDRDIILSRLSVIGAYIKRRGNLVIISEDKKLIRAKEVEFCIEETMSNLKLLDIQTAYTFELSGEISASVAIRIYDIFEYFTEALLEDINAVFVKISEGNGNISLRIMFGVSSDGFSLEAFSVMNDFITSIEYMDKDIVVDALIAKEDV